MLSSSEKISSTKPTRKGNPADFSPAAARGFEVTLDQDGACEFKYLVAQSG
jgi:hypothetical protein